ncbi:MAG: 23S rRNA (pseudouridine(1915)-N(3))-methyltransferase RlmH [Acholeplasmatales bacterium]|nr:23S rRNA (pseudouridine(1915)-N(3))-methyltransferase RlmH [Acholeplasmatales bacterium]
MKITIISVGKLKEQYLADGIKEYIKRISKYSEVKEIVLKDMPIPTKESDAIDQEIKRKEGLEILEAIPSNSYKVVLDLKGEMIDSPGLAKKLLEIQTYHSSHIVFIIGGSLGLSDEVLRSADYHLCFSKMTFPHQLMKLILLEQIYRGFKINNNETYHK